MGGILRPLSPCGRMEGKEVIIMDCKRYQLLKDLTAEGFILDFDTIPDTLEGNLYRDEISHLEKLDYITLLHQDKGFYQPCLKPNGREAIEDYEAELLSEKRASRSEFRSNISLFLAVVSILLSLYSIFRSCSSI